MGDEKLEVLLALENLEARLRALHRKLSDPDAAELERLESLCRIWAGRVEQMEVRNG
jgi:hypothetical protein